MLCAMPAHLLPSDLPRAQRRRARTQLTIGAALLVLGLGNITYGRIKQTEYKRLLSEAASELTSTEKKPGLSILTPTVNIDKHAQYVQKLRSHSDFYRFVMLGGSCFCLSGLIFSALAFLSTRPKPEHNDGAAPNGPA